MTQLQIMVFFLSFQFKQFYYRNTKNGLQLAFSSYAEITNFLQGIVDNEANLNSGSSCAGSCSDYRQTRHFHCQSGSLCDRSINDHDPRECYGIIRDCQEIDDTDVNICETVCMDDDMDARTALTDHEHGNSQCVHCALAIAWNTLTKLVIIVCLKCVYIISYIAGRIESSIQLHKVQ